MYNISAENFSQKKTRGGSKPHSLISLIRMQSDQANKFHAHKLTHVQNTDVDYFESCWPVMRIFCFVSPPHLFLRVGGVLLSFRLSPQACRLPEGPRQSQSVDLCSSWTALAHTLVSLFPCVGPGCSLFHKKDGFKHAVFSFELAHKLDMLSVHFHKKNSN